MAVRPTTYLLLGTVLFLTLAVCSWAKRTHPDPVHDASWRNFKTKHGKKYKDDAHETQRRLVFEDHLEKINRHNDEANRGMHKHTLKVTKFSDWTVDEFKSYLTYSKPTGRTPHHSESRDTFQSRALPTTVRPSATVPASKNWVTEGYVTAVKDQGDCGGCYAFSTTGALEGQMFKQTRQLVSLSEQDIIDCSTGVNYGCGGGTMEDSLIFLQQAGGIERETDYPFMSGDTGLEGGCQFDRSQSVLQVSGYRNVRPTEADLKTAVGTIGPISVAVYADDMQHYDSGVFSSSYCPADQIDHAVLCVGYGTAPDGTAYWLIKNSWGPDWGESGYIRLARNQGDMCGVSSDTSYPILAPRPGR